ncbi:MAG TPA: A/G-specific adenine glycosylase [Xanthobacteraceae bacterium]|nr:A/G-specific adenine glycosylase [Xanthobacteraceae bacterium]
MLAWYDRHRRKLPWRARPGERADPYRVWLSEIMLQQTRVSAVLPYYAKFLERWPSVGALAATPLEEVLKVWAGLGYYARARNLHSCARALVERHGGEFPREESELRTLPGIGAYTAAAIATIAFGRPITPVDGNVERVIARLFRVETSLPAAKPEIRRLAETLTPETRAGDFAQAMMDLGAMICTPVSPGCGVCPWLADCGARAMGDAEDFPRREAKRATKLRRGAAFLVLRADRSILVRSRPPRGLLGGMTELPTTQWTEDFAEHRALLDAPPFSSRQRWRRVPGVVTHAFTHFPLELVVYATEVALDTPPPAGMRFVPLDRLHDEALPNLMRKVVALALGEVGNRNVSSAPSRRAAWRAVRRSG